MSSLRNKVDCTYQNEKKQHTLKVKQDLPTTVKETTKLLKVAQKIDTNNMEGISIQKNNIIKESGKGIHCKSTQYVSLKSSYNF